MPRAPNPLYAPRYNDPALGAAANNIGALLLGGDSPNERALAESEAALRAAQTRDAAAKAGVGEILLQDISDPRATALRRVNGAEGLTPEQLPYYHTASQSRINPDAPKNIAEAENLNRDVAGMLAIDPSSAPSAVARRNAAVKGDALVDVSNEQLADPFDIKAPPVVTPGGRAANRKTDAEAEAAKDKGAKARAMPPASIKQLNESREALRTAQGMEATFSEMRALVSGGQPDESGGKTEPLQTGPLDKGIAAVQQWTGKGDANSRGLLALKQKREKLRGDYLLLAKGVQTEGDAVRAMDAMMPDTNDPKAIVQQIAAVEQASKRLQEIHRESVNQIEAEYGREATGGENPFKPPAAAPAAAKPASGGVVRWGRDADGKPVRLP